MPLASTWRAGGWSVGWGLRKAVAPLHMQPIKQCDTHFLLLQLMCHFISYHSRSMTAVKIPMFFPYQKLEGTRSCRVTSVALTLEVSIFQPQSHKNFAFDRRRWYILGIVSLFCWKMKSRQMPFWTCNSRTQKKSVSNRLLLWGYCCRLRKR